MIDRVAFTIFGKDIYWYGIIITLGMLAGILVVRQMFKRKGLHPDLVIDMALIVVPLAIICARAHYVIWSWEEFAGGPFWKVFAMWEGGMAIYGGLIGGFIGVVIFSLWKKINLLTLCDTLAPGVALGQAIGRWGNFVNQEVYGGLVTNPAWQFFPASVYIESSGTWHQALFFYESMWNLAAFLVLYLVITRRAKVRGVAFCSYFVIYGVARAALEPLREAPYIQNVNGIPVNQIFAIVLAVLGCAGILCLTLLAKKHPALLLESVPAAAPQADDAISQELTANADAAEKAPSAPTEAATESAEEAAPASAEAVTENAGEAAPASAEAVTENAGEAAPASAEAVTENAEEAAPASAEAATESAEEAAPASTEAADVQEKPKP